MQLLRCSDWLFVLLCSFWGVLGGCQTVAMFYFDSVHHSRQTSGSPSSPAGVRKENRSGGL